MNNKLEKYREERDKYLEKAALYQARAKEVEQKIMAGENLEIRAMMQDEHLTLPELMALVRGMQEQRRVEDARLDNAGDAFPSESPAAYTNAYDEMEDTDDEKA